MQLGDLIVRGIILPGIICFEIWAIKKGINEFKGIIKKLLADNNTNPNSNIPASDRNLSDELIIIVDKIKSKEAIRENSYERLKNIEVI